MYGATTDASYSYYGYQVNKAAFRILNIYFLKCYIIKSTCKLSNKPIVYKPTNFRVAYNEKDLQFAVATAGPVAVTMYAGAPTFAYYKGGIYDDYNECYKGYTADHGKLIIIYVFMLLKRSI